MTLIALVLSAIVSFVTPLPHRAAPADVVGPIGESIPTPAPDTVGPHAVAGRR